VEASARSAQVRRDRQDAESKYFSINKLMDLLKGTPVYEEAIRDIVHDSLIWSAPAIFSAKFKTATFK